MQRKKLVKKGQKKERNDRESKQGKRKMIEKRSNKGVGEDDGESQEDEGRQRGMQEMRILV